MVWLQIFSQNIIVFAILPKTSEEILSLYIGTFTGFSDPFCEVRIGHERKFTTSVKKKTLNPIWDEWVTMQLPKPDDVLEIVSKISIHNVTEILALLCAHWKVTF